MHTRGVNKKLLPSTSAIREPMSPFFFLDNALFFFFLFACTSSCFFLFLFWPVLSILHRIPLLKQHALFALLLRSARFIFRITLRFFFLVYILPSCFAFLFSFSFFFFLIGFTWIQFVGFPLTKQRRTLIALKKELFRNTLPPPSRIQKTQITRQINKQKNIYI